MPQITIDEDTHQRLQLAARVARISVPEVIRLLANEERLQPDVDKETSDPRRVPIYAGYKGKETTAEFDVRTHKIKITSGKLKGTTFNSPSAAAIAVVKSLNPDRDNPHTNGWRFWKDTATRKSLERRFKPQQ